MVIVIPSTGISARWLHSFDHVISKGYSQQLSRSILHLLSWLGTRGLSNIC